MHVGAAAAASTVFHRFLLEGLLICIADLETDINGSTTAFIFITGTKPQIL